MQLVIEAAVFSEFFCVSIFYLAACTMVSNYRSYNKSDTRALLNTCLILKALPLLQNAFFFFFLF